MKYMTQMLARACNSSDNEENCPATLVQECECPFAKDCRDVTEKDWALYMRKGPQEQEASNG